MTPTRAFVEAIFFENTIQEFYDLTNQIVPKQMFYYSDKLPTIQGNVCKSLHLTIFFGLDELDKDNPEIQKILKNFNKQITEIHTSQLSLINGFRNLYQILVAKVMDRNNILKSANREVFEYILGKNFTGRQREFFPHLTLAYVKNEYVPDQKYLNVNKKIKIKQIQITTTQEHSERLQKANEK